MRQNLREMLGTYILGPVAVMASMSVPVLAAEPIVLIETNMKADEEDLLRSVLGEVEAPARSLAQARRRVEKAAESARTVLRSLGYYDAVIEAEVIETKTGPASNDGVAVRRPPQAILRITSGERFKFGDVDVRFTNSLPDIADEMNSIIGFESGVFADSAKVVAAEIRLVNYLQSKGYPEAKAQPRTVVVDHATQKMNVTYNIFTGRRTRFGDIQQTGTAYLRESWPKMISPFERGDLYSAADINRLAARVIGTGVFDATTATLSDDLVENADGTITRDVILDVEQGAINTISGEIGVSTSDGSGVDLVYERRNFIGFAQTLKLNATARTNEISAGLSYNIPYAWREDRELDLSADIARLDTQALDGDRARANALVTQKMSSKLRVGLGIGIEASRFDQNGEEVTAYLVDGLGRAVYDTRDDVLNPVKGVNLEAKLVPTYNFGEEDGSFATLSIGGSTYRRVSDKFVLAGRLLGGTIVSDDFATVPQNRRFYAGGGGSVRGFEYQSVSPLRDLVSLNDAGETVISEERIGGRTLLEGSAEVRYKGDGPIGYVGFVDAGSVSRSYDPSFDDIRVGAGVGVRYYTNFAPLRADIAIPLNPRSGDADFQLYISIGQAF
jgi:translocation and assembly module TamA